MELYQVTPPQLLCSHFTLTFPFRAGLGVKPCTCAVQLSWGLPKAASQPGFGALDSPLLGWFAVSVTATEKFFVACAVLLFQAGELQHSLQGEIPKPSLLQNSECLWVDCAHTHTYQMLGAVPLKRERNSHESKPDSSVNVGSYLVKSG